MQLARPAPVAVPPSCQTATPLAQGLRARLTRELSWYAPWRISRSGLVLVTAGHALLLWWLMHHVTPVEKPLIPVLTVSLLTAPSAPAPPEPTPPAPQPQVRPLKPQLKPRPATPLLTSPQATPTPDSPAPQPAELPESAAQSAAAPPAAAAAPVAAAAAPRQVAPRFDAAYLDNPRPIYPLISRRMGEQGKVMLLVAVDAQGAPSDVRLHASSGSSRLDNAAIEAVRRWRFVPARQGDTAIAASVIVPIDFSLKD